MSTLINAHIKFSCLDSVGDSDHEKEKIEVIMKLVVLKILNLW